jgi:predicted hydrolase (HD superfamily)
MGEIFDFLEYDGKLTENEPPREDWVLAGLIHDIDYAGDFKPDHPKRTKEALAKYNLDIPESVDNIVKAHGPAVSGVNPVSKAQWALFCADSLTGLIMAVAMIRSSKKIADVETSSVLKRFLKEPKFAAGTRREEVAMCADANGLNIPLEKFIGICLSAMRKISADIGM